MRFMDNFQKAVIDAKKKKENNDAIFNPLIKKVIEKAGNSAVDVAKKVGNASKTTSTTIENPKTKPTTTKTYNPNLDYSGITNYATAVDFLRKNRQDNLANSLYDERTFENLPYFVRKGYNDNYQNYLDKTIEKNMMMYNISKDQGKREAYKYENVSTNHDFEEYVKKGKARTRTNIIPSKDSNFDKYTMGNRVEETRKGYDVSMHYGGAGGKVGQMTDDEVDIYSYLLAKYGYDEAEEYIKTLDTSLTSRLGEEISGRIINGSPLEKAFLYPGMSMARGIDQVVTKLDSIPAYISASDDVMGATPLEIGGEKVKDSIDNKFGRWLYDAGTNVVAQAPQFAAGLIGGRMTQAAVAGLLSAGGDYRQGILEGRAPREARFHGTLIGGLEAALGYAFNAAGGKMGIGTEKLDAKIKLISNAFGRGMAKFGLSSGSELLEEEGQLYLGNLVDSLIYGEDLTAPEMEEVIDTAMVTLLSTGMLSGGDVVNTARMDNSTYGSKVLDDFHIDNKSDRDMFVDAIINEGLFTKKGTDSYIMAKTLQGKVKNGKEITDHQLGTLYDANVRNANAAKNTETDIPGNDFIDAIEERNLPLEERLLRAAAREKVDYDTGFSRAGKVKTTKGYLQKVKGYGYGKKGENTFMKVMTENQWTPETTQKRFRAAYDAGFLGLRRDQVEILNPTQESAYYAGREDAILSMDDAKAKGVAAWGSESGLVRNKYSQKYDESTFSAVDTMGKAMGTKIIVENIPQEMNSNGYYRDQDGTIHIGTNIADPVMTVVKHEVTHRMKDLAPKEYIAYRNYAVKVMGSDAVSIKKIEYQENGEINLSREKAMDEVAADFTRKLLTDPKALEDFINHAKTSEENMSMAEKFFEAIREFFVKIRETFNGNRQKMNEETIKEFGVTISQLEKAERLWREAYNSAEATAKKTEKTQSDIVTKNETDNTQNMYIGKNAKIRRDYRLSKAKSMENEGMSKEEIFKKTGWFRGADGRWRFEISDKDFTYKQPKTLSREDTERYWEIFMKIASHKSSEAEKREFSELGEHILGYALEEVIDHKDLFRAYPKLKKIRVIRTDDLPENTGGGYDPERKIIFLKSTYSPELNRYAITHEIQHAIQHIEGFSMGANDKIWERKIKEGFSKVNSMTGQPMAAYDLYMNSAGEIEARDVQKRRNLTDEQRRENFPSIGDEDTVFIDFQDIIQHKKAYEKKSNENIMSENVENRMMNYVAHEENRGYNKEGLMYSLKKDKSNGGYTEKEYRAYGWARANNLLTAGQNKDYRSKFADAKSGRAWFNTNQSGEFIIPVSDIFDSSKRGINDTLVFASGTIENPIISSIIKINEDNETVLDIIRRHIYDCERRGIQPKIEGAIRRYDAIDFRGIKKQRDILSSSAHSADNGYGRGNSQETKSNEDDSKISYSLKGESQIMRDYDLMKRGKLSQEEFESRYYDLIEKNGAIEPGEKPARDIKVPKKTDDRRKVSQIVRTILEAKVTPDEALPTIKEMVVSGDFSYDVYTDKQAIKDAGDYIGEHGFQETANDWFDSMKKGKVSKRNTAVGWALYNNAINTAKNATSKSEKESATKTALDILNAMVGHQRNAAQALQATRILKKLEPETQLYNAQRVVDSFQRELIDKYGDKAPNLEIDSELAEKFLNAETREVRDEALREIYRSIGKQMPSGFVDKLKAWRYLSMLGNPRTHIRNVLGNAGFAPIVLTKDTIATGIESVLRLASGGKFEGSKAFVNLGKKDRALIKAAWSDYSNVSDIVANGEKYNDSLKGNKYIEEGIRIFKNKALETVRKGNSALLEMEDVWFSRPHYAYALAQYCKAHNITAEQVARGMAIAPARAYAIKEAQKATYRDTNAFSQMVSGWGRTQNEDNIAKKAFGVVLEGTLPFRKTPANILVRGVEYSPIGLLKGLTADLMKVKQGKITPAEAIDNISAGLTGTGLVMLGVYLAAQGLIRGHGGDDEEENEFKELMGHQAYSLEVGDNSVTLDWLAPEALPFFVGVNLWEMTEGKKENIDLATILTAVGNVSEPMLEMSCLQSLNDLFESVGYATSDGVGALPTVLVSATTSYLTQFIPTIFGQAERTSEGVRMTTHAEKNKFLTPGMQRTLGKVSAKIPGWDFNQIPYIDAWGRNEASGNKLKRGANNFLNPAYTSNIEMSGMEKELLRLYEATGEDAVLPKRADKSFKVDGVEKVLTGEEYVRYATKKGQVSYDMVTELTSSGEYKTFTDEERVQAIQETYKYAEQKAKSIVSAYKPSKWTENFEKVGAPVYTSYKIELSKVDDNGNYSNAEKADAIFAMGDLTNDEMAYLWDSEQGWEAYEKGVRMDKYIDFKDKASGFTSEKDANGKSISGSKKAKVVDYLNDAELTDEEWDYFYYELMGYKR